MFQAPFSFNGRIRRSEFGFSFIIYAICYILLELAVPAGSQEMGLLGLAFIPLIWFMWAQAAKRCHDLGRNGFWLFVPFYILWLLFQDGDAGLNEYGANPKAFDGILPSTEQNHELQEITSNDHLTYPDGHIDLTKK